MWSLVAVTLCLQAAGASPSHTEGSRRSWDTISKRMHGGHAVEISQFPWLVAVIFDDKHNCGGSIISERWVMTAAHCISSGSSERYKVRAGSSNWDKGGILYTCNDLIIHSSYSSTTADYDIGLIEINGTIQMDDNVKIVSLATSEPGAGTSMNVSGWGDTSPGTGSTLTLYAATVEILERSSCNSTLQGNVTDNMICTVVDETGKGPCKGDSGGALVADGTQYGLVSWRWAECGMPAIPTVYTSVAALRSWIEEKMGMYFPEQFDHQNWIKDPSNAELPSTLPLENKRNSLTPHSNQSSFHRHWLGFGVGEVGISTGNKAPRVKIPFTASILLEIGFSTLAEMKTK